MKSKTTYTRAEADEIVDLIRQKLKADPSRQKAIRAKIRARGFWASDFGFRDGYTEKDFLSVVKIVSEMPGKVEASTPVPADRINKSAPVNVRKGKRSQSDEAYVIDLCDEVLKLTAERQHRFEFLRGDSGSKLPVDAWYPSLNLVVEFRERQHTEDVKFFDRRQTVSGVGRGEQRRLYDQRRREVLPQHGIGLVEFNYSDFNHTRTKKLERSLRDDTKVIRDKLKKYVK